LNFNFVDLMKHCKANHIWNGNLQSFVSDTRIILVLTWSNRISKYWNSSFVYMQVIQNNIYTTPPEQLQIPVGKSWKQRRDRYPYIHDRSLAWFSRGLSITSDIYPLNEMMQSCKCRTNAESSSWTLSIIYWMFLTQKLSCV